MSDGLMMPFAWFFGIRSDRSRRWAIQVCRIVKVDGVPSPCDVFWSGQILMNLGRAF